MVSPQYLCVDFFVIDELLERFVMAGTITFTNKVIDSKGRTSYEKTVFISGVTYSQPSVSSYISQRCNSAGTIQDAGTYVKGLVSFSYSSCSSKNTILQNGFDYYIVQKMVERLLEKDLISVDEFNKISAINLRKF